MLFQRAVYPQQHIGQVFEDKDLMTMHRNYEMYGLTLILTKISNRDEKESFQLLGKLKGIKSVCCLTVLFTIPLNGLLCSDVTICLAKVK